MKVSDSSLHDKLAPGLALPDDFARTVIVRARTIRRRRQLGRRLAAGLAVLLLAAYIPHALRRPNTLDQVAQSPTAAHEALIADWQTTDQTDALRLAEATDPDAVSDYLMPDTAVLRQFASGYSDAAWNYDPNWADDSESTTNG